MLYMDTLKILIGFLVWHGMTLAASPEDGKHDSKRIQPLPSEPDPYVTQTTEGNSNNYPDDYDKNHDQIEISEKYIEPQRRQTHLQDEYHEEKTIEYMDEDRKVPQAYKFGFEIKDKKEGHQFRQEQKDEHGNIQGRFGYRDAKGQYRHVEYVADDYGFRAKVKTNEAGTANENPADVEIHSENNNGHQQHIPQNQNVMSHNAESTDIYKTEKAAGSDHQSQQSVTESEPQSEETRYGSQRSGYLGYEPYHQDSHDHEEPEAVHYRSNMKTPDEQTGRHTPRSYRYFINERTPHSGYEHSSIEREPEKHYRKYSRRPVERQQGSRVPSHSTYQYELEGDRYVYKYAKQPSQSEREVPQVDHAYEDYEQEYRAPKHEHTAEYVHPDTESHLPEDYEGYRNTDMKDNSHRSREKGLILPQRAESDRNAHKYHHGQREEQEHADRSYPEGYRILKYDYHDEAGRDDKSKVMKPVHKAVPVVHQYVQIINEPQRPSVSDYDKTHHSAYGYRQAPPEKIVPQQHSIVYLEPESEGKHHQQEPHYAYGKRDNMYSNLKHDESYHPIKLDSLTGYHSNAESLSSKPSQSKDLQGSNGSPNKNKLLQKAVLELNSDVYKKLIQNKTPGTRFVAVPLNGHMESSDPDKMNHPNAPQPHGILHIPLNGDSPTSIDLKSLVLHIPHKEAEKPESPELKYEDYVPHGKKRVVYSHESPSHREAEKSEPPILKYADYIPQGKKRVIYSHETPSPAAPMYKHRRHQTKDYSNSKWIPIAPSWNQIRRKSSKEANTESTSDTQAPHGYTLQLSNEDAFKFLQGESSHHAVELGRKPEKMPNKKVLTSLKKKTPRVYILSSSYRNVSPLKDSKKQSTLILPRI